jgi:hypothetical protein
MVMESDNITMAELRGMAREIEDARRDAEVRRSVFGMALLDESLSVFNLDENVVAKIEKLKGEPLHQLQQELFAIFAKAGKRITEESFEQRVRQLLVRYATPEKRPRKKRQPRSE